MKLFNYKYRSLFFVDIHRLNYIKMRNLTSKSRSIIAYSKSLFVKNTHPSFFHGRFTSTAVLPQVDFSENKPENVSLNPIHHEDYFGVKKMVTVKDLFNARVHYGHKEGSLNNNMLPYIFGSRMGHLIFDLDKTLQLLHQALNFVAHIAYRDGIILFVTQSAQNSHLVEQTAQECKEFAHTRYWRQGMFTNSTMLYGAVTRLPDVVVLFNTLTTVLEEHLAIKEAAKMAIPTVGVVDSNCNPNLITYPVPGNDDTPVAIQLYCRLFKEAILKGKAERRKVLEICKS
uniref:Small ribosomal subunit protein uS2m n=1 Tax=Graphocephala atropunctata TaxID=36148 RepID=A0A1B6L498_9HEMI